MNPSVQFRLIIGADSIPQLPDWHRWPDIAAHYDPIIVGRQGHTAPPNQRTVDFPNVSSTEVRTRLRDGLPIDHLVTQAVAAVLRDGSSGAAWASDRPADD
jgi:nicotinate-nucleotide adenylyltransferase